MTDLRKAAEMALEVFDGPVLKDPAENAMKLRKACDLLRQALAQPEHEPVAWADKVGAVIPYSHKLFQPDLLKDYTRPLYTAPPKREWVGLSSLDKTFLRTAYAQLRPLYHDKKEDVNVAAEVVTDWDGFFAAINDMLKEKNGG